MKDEQDESGALATVRAHYAASDRGDLDGMLAPLAAEVSWTEAVGFPCAGTYVGPDAVRANVFERLAREWDGYTAQVEEVRDAGAGTVVGIGTYSATYRATGKSMNARFVHIWRIAGGEVQTFEQVTDSAVVRAAMVP